ncbi:bifunctional diguanylate cyclase/phosphodiesterase [Paucibacter sp. KCTC 42545]|uniref:bifunctional diguanylate cyclase/phosphodiesterase n=1 Tax=Paucibacter sp. KCTC 42545 TaxID=1768242 RepID=UPI0009E916D6|nr:EAL domain-containing protein [Paucibacter sp. KCTC 42545]
MSSPAPHSANRPGSAFCIQQFHAQWLVFALVCAIVAVSAGIWLRHERAQLQQQESQRLQGLVQVLDGIVAQQLHGIQAALQTIDDSHGKWRNSQMQQDARPLLSALAQAMPGVRMAAIIDARGRMRATSLAELPNFDASTRDYFLMPKTAPQYGMLYVSPPYSNALGEYTMSLSRALFDARGQFAGVAMVTLDPDYFKLVLGTAQTSDDTWSALVHADGMLYSLRPQNNDWMGRRLLDRPGSLLARHLASGQDASVQQGLALVSRDERLTALQTVRTPGLQTNRALIVAVGRQISALEAPWQRQWQQTLGAGLLLAMVSGLALWLRQRRLRSIAALREAQRRSDHDKAQHTQAVLDNMVDGVITIDARGLILSFNASACRMFGYSAEEVIGRNVSLLMPEPEASQHDGYLRNYLGGNQARVIGVGRDVTGRRKSGSNFPMSLAVSSIERDGEPLFIGLTRDITERKRAEAAIEKLAFNDPLTGLPNRRLLLDRLNQTLASAQRQGRHGAVLFIDLDNFKSLNDTLGHGMGDLLLQSIAQRLLGTVRAQDSVARWGGDEFVVLLQDLGQDYAEAAQHAEAAAEKILRVLGQPYQLKDHLHHSTPSIGIKVWGAGDGSSSEDLLKHADHAMYQAKAGGRNQLCFFDPVTQAAMAERATLEADLRGALQNDQFALYLQAQVNQHGQLTGAEVLLRWQHPQRGWISPAQFIPLAEQTGLIVPLGAWVMQQACALLALWAGQPRLEGLSLAVNVSAVQFRHKGFLSTLQQILARSNAPTERLKIELTESALVDDVEGVIRLMTELGRLGVGLSLDDFGTGYSSLAYLKRLPLKQLKIDQSFVRDLISEPNAHAIAHAIVQLGDSLGLHVIAEGVETEAQRDLLAQLGCHAYQGYLFGRPMPIEAFVAGALQWPKPMAGQTQTAEPLLTQVTSEDRPADAPLPA